MNNATIQLKIQQRLNKIASNDYDNIECWQIVEAFNATVEDKEQLESLRSRTTKNRERLEAMPKASCSRCHERIDIDGLEGGAGDRCGGWCCERLWWCICEEVPRDQRAR